jgi:hypothetical protein
VQADQQLGRQTQVIAVEQVAILFLDRTQQQVEQVVEVTPKLHKLADQAVVVQELLT